AHARLVDHDERQPERQHRPEARAVEADRLGDDLPHGPLARRQRCWAGLWHGAQGIVAPVGYDVVRAADIAWEERPGHEGQAPRRRRAGTPSSSTTSSTSSSLARSATSPT